MNQKEKDINKLSEILKDMHGMYIVKKAIAIHDGSYYKDQNKFHKDFYTDYAKKILNELVEWNSQ